MASPEVYQASKIKRRRATKAEMEERAKFLITYAEAHGPVTVRGLYYQAEVAKLPGIDKADYGYNKISGSSSKAPACLSPRLRAHSRRHPLDAEAAHV